MNHNRALSLFFLAALFVATLFVINSVSATSVLQVGGREARADQADIQRWAALGEYFSKQPASDANGYAKLSRDVNAARWQALGEAYLAIDLRSRQADAARWQALGESYLGINLGARQADAARWQAIGEYYTKLNT